MQAWPFKLPLKTNYRAGGSRAWNALRSQAVQLEVARRSKRAKLAVRRFLRQRLKQSEVEVAGKLAQSNAAVFPKVAASLMGFDENDKEAEQGKMRAGILCFDEININDPFTAIALKGKSSWLPELKNLLSKGMIQNASQAGRLRGIVNSILHI